MSQAAGFRFGHIRGGWVVLEAAKEVSRDRGGGRQRAELRQQLLDALLRFLVEQPSQLFLTEGAAIYVGLNGLLLGRAQLTGCHAPQLFGSGMRAHERASGACASVRSRRRIAARSLIRVFRSFTPS